MLSGEKRVRLRDYLFVARSSVQKNSGIMKQLKNSVPNQGETQNLQKIKRSKYSLSNKQIHQIVKKQLQKQMEYVIKSMREDLDFIKNLDLEHLTDEDLIYLHQVRGILTYKIVPALKQINQIGSKRQGNLFKEIISLGQNLAHIKQPQNQQLETKTLFTVKVSKAQTKNPNNWQDKGQQEVKLSPKMAKPPSFAKNAAFESLMASRNPEI